MNPGELEQQLRSEDPEERRKAVALLAGSNHPGLVALLVERLGDENWRVRKEATNVAISRSPDPTLLSALIEVLQPGENVGLRNAAVEALAGFGAHGVEAIGRVVHYLDPDGRKLAAEALAASRQGSALRVLERMLADPDANVRAATIDALAAVGEDHREKVSDLFAQAIDMGDSYQRLVVLEGVNRLGLNMEWERIEPLLEEPLLKTAGLLAAGRAGHIGAAPRIVEQLKGGIGYNFSAGLGALAELVTSGEGGLAAAKAAVANSTEDLALRCFAIAQNPGEALEDRRHALLALGAVGGEQAVQLALDSLADDQLASEADRTLMMLGADAIPVLGNLSQVGDSDQRAVSLELLGRLADHSTKKAVIGLVRSAMRDESLDVLRAALGVLARIGGPETLKDAGQWFRDDVPAPVRLAARAAIVACARRFPQEVAGFITDATPDTPEAAAPCLVLGVCPPGSQWSSSEEIQFLAFALANPSELVRRTALEALATRRAASAVDAIAFAVTDEAEEVRMVALRALGRIRGEDGDAIALDRLLELLEATEDITLRVGVVDALGDTGDPRAADVLTHLVSERNTRIAVAAVEALAALKAAPDWIQSALDHPDPEVAKATMSVLPEVMGRQSVAQLTRCLEHDAWDVRRMAADLLGQTSTQSGRAALRARDQYETEPLVREAIRRSLSHPVGDGGSKT